MDKDCHVCEGTGKVTVDVWTGWQFGGARREDCDECGGSGVIEYAFEFEGEFYKTREEAEEAVMDKYPHLGDDDFADFFTEHVSAI